MISTNTIEVTTMAKVTGPLMSMDASGKFGDALVFGKWKGRNTVRQLVTPANPNSQGQENARNRTRVTGALQLWANQTTLKAQGKTLTDKERIKAVTPAGFAWNGYLTEKIIGKGGLTYDAAQTAYGALAPAEKTAWDNAAAALSPVINSIFQTVAGGGAGTPLTGGNAWFIYQYGLAQIGLAATPGATPPTYA